MDENVLTREAAEKIKTIHRLSAVYNEQCRKSHHEQLFKLVDKHAQEIRQLYEEKDPHYLIETGDLLILCYEVLLEGGADIDQVTRECFKRYEKKLTELMNDLKEARENSENTKNRK